MNYERMEASPEMDYLIGIKIMEFTTAKYFKNGGGCYPADAKKVRHGKTAWDARAEDGSYPFLLKSGTIFWEKKGYGDIWAPTKLISQAWSVLETMDLFKNMDLDKINGLYRLCNYTRDGTRMAFVTAPTASLAICRAALKVWASSKKD